jgi:predicted ATP-binding protein involved in virulence
MKLKRLKMQSFRGISDLTLEFKPDHPTVLIGINGAGKSSVLDCLAIYLSSYTIAAGLISDNSFNSQKIIDQAPLSGDVYTQLCIPNDRHARFSRSLMEHDIKFGENQTSNEITLTFGTEEIVFSLQMYRGLPLDPAHVMKTLGNIVNQVHSEAQHQIDSVKQLNLPIVVYYRVNRVVSDVSIDLLHDNAQAHLFNPHVHSISGAQANFGDFFRWFRLTEDLENEERRRNPDHRDRQLVAVRSAIEALNLGFKDLQVHRRAPLRMTVTKDGRELVINQLSDGEKCLLAMVGDLARRLAIAQPSLANPLEGEGIVLIDEIELHLHPQWQRGIVNRLTTTFPNCQFILSTHSPQVISDVQPDNIYILESTPNGIIASHPQYSFGRDTSQILEDLMGTNSRGGEASNIPDRIAQLYRLIALGDLDQAHNLHEELAHQVGLDEPELAGARTAMKRREILGR